MKNQEFMRFTLWFDVEKIGYTTNKQLNFSSPKLWFDVEKIGYTTYLFAFKCFIGCGLM